MKSGCFNPRESVFGILIGDTCALYSPSGTEIFIVPIGRDPKVFLKELINVKKHSLNQHNFNLGWKRIFTMRTFCSLPQLITKFRNFFRAGASRQPLVSKTTYSNVVDSCCCHQIEIDRQFHDFTSDSNSSAQSIGESFGNNKLDGTWKPTHRHTKRGTEYAVVGQAQVQCEDGLTDYEVVTVYQGSDGELWVRRKSEFEDGRFVACTHFQDEAP